MKKYILTLAFHCVLLTLTWAQPGRNKIWYGVAYYYEYMPYERLDKDVEMMKDCGVNIVRLAESTWGVWEPQDGVFDFSKLDLVLNAMQKAGIKVIIGTPTYAFPTWLAKMHPEILATTPWGKNKYGARQNMDITSPVFRFYAERIIRKLMEHVKDNPVVIGYQADNETKHYNTAGDSVQAQFVRYLKEKFKAPDSLTKAFGLNYWSNSIHNWNDMPSTIGNVNASLGSEFSKFQRKLVTDYLNWQVAIIREYKRADQFVTHNFDMDWRGWSYGIQQDVDHFEAAKAFDMAGIDIYHPTADRLTGIEISFGGDLARSMKQHNYLVLETQAQSLAGRQELLYPGQLRLQAFSHLASGANMVEYWPWHSIHNSVETYWKGLLSHDMEPNPTYIEAKQIAADLNRIGDHIVNLKKTNKVAILFSNESLTSLNWFPVSDKYHYNDIVRLVYDRLYNMNVGCDFVNPNSTNIEDYSLLIVPALYTATDSLLERLNKYAQHGGHILYTFKSGFCNENTQVRSSKMPGLLSKACGFSYQQFTNIDKLSLKGDPFHTGSADNYVTEWIELLTPSTAKVLAYYDHPYWGKYAAITQNKFGKGMVTYMGAIPSKGIVDKLLRNVVNKAGLTTVDQQIRFPLIVKHGVNQYQKNIHYYFNYSSSAHALVYPYKNGKDLLAQKAMEKGSTINLAPWGLVLIEEN